jgi:dephospho-CoA kinase
MLAAALTGNFGMGKSFVLSVFRDLGAATLESDRLVNTILAERDVIARVKDLLGGDVCGPDGSLDKKRVAEKIFSDPKLRSCLEAIIHPIVLERVDEFILSVRERFPVAVIEVPLLFEGGYSDRFQKVITVFAPEETALQRLMESGITRDNAMARLRNQLPIETKKKRADFTIDNGGSREETRKQVEVLYRTLLGCPADPVTGDPRPQ